MELGLGLGLGLGLYFARIVDHCLIVKGYLIVTTGSKAKCAPRQVSQGVR